MIEYTRAESGCKHSLIGNRCFQNGNMYRIAKVEKYKNYQAEAENIIYRLVPNSTLTEPDAFLLCL